MKPVTHDGGTIHAMSYNGPGTNDAVSHTLRHFVRPYAPIAAYPAGTMDAETAREGLIGQGVPIVAIERLPFGQGDLAPLWARREVYERVVPIHEEGYAPRYLAIARGTPLPDRAGTRWEYDPKHTNYRVFEPRVLVWVCADWNRKARALRVKTTIDKMRSASPEPPPDPDPENTRFLDMVRRR